MPVNVTGLNVAPAAGEHFYVLDDIATARQIAEKRESRFRRTSLSGAPVHVTLENLPRALVEQMVGDNGEVRVQIFPSEDLSDHASLAQFVDAVKGAAPDVTFTGSAAEIVESGRSVVRSLQQALLALVAIAVILILSGGRHRTALVLTPSLAAVFTAATAVLFDIASRGRPCCAAARHGRR
jgi:hypothetical protein